jgi:hypothetical protein
MRFSFEATLVTSVHTALLGDGYPHSCDVCPLECRRDRGPVSKAEEAASAVRAPVPRDMSQHDCRPGSLV